MPTSKDKVEDSANVDFSTQFSRLRYTSGERLSALPDWAQFFLDLGASLADFRAEHLRYVAAIAVPARTFAVPFLGAGYSCAYFLLRKDLNVKHIETIRSLPNGTPVRFVDRYGRLKKGIKREAMVIDGVERIGIQDEGEGRKTVFLLPEETSRVEISEERHTRLPNRQAGRKMRVPSILLAGLLKERSSEYIFQSATYGVVVGSLSSLRLEAQAQLSFGDSSHALRPGSLQELFRVEGINPGSSGHRLVMHHVNSECPPSQRRIGTNRLAIFDGSLAFTKWKEYYRGHNWIAVLDRTEPSFPVAVSQINSDYTNRSERELRIPLPPTPPGVELMLFARDV